MCFLLPFISANLNFWILISEIRKIIICGCQLKMLIVFFKGSDKKCRAAVEKAVDTLLHILWNIVFIVILLFIWDTRSNAQKIPERGQLHHTEMSCWETNCTLFSFWLLRTLFVEVRMLLRILFVLSFFFLSEKEKSYFVFVCLFVSPNCYSGKILVRQFLPLLCLAFKFTL